MDKYTLLKRVRGRIADDAFEAIEQAFDKAEKYDAMIAAPTAARQYFIRGVWTDKTNIFAKDFETRELIVRPTPAGEV